MGKIKKLFAVLLASLSVLTVGCSGGETMSEEESAIQLNAKAGTVIDCTPSIYKAYLSATTEAEQAKVLMNYNNNGIAKPVPEAQSVILSWKRSGSSYNRYTLRVSKNADLTDPIFQGETTDTFMEVGGSLLPGTYYWGVADILGNESVTDSFVISNYVRALNVDGIKNFRDLGGWKTESGKTIKYGMSYRSAALQESSGNALLELGLKTEIDLRANEGDKTYTQSVIPAEYGFRYLQAGIMQSDYVLKDKSFYSSLTPEQIVDKRHESATFKQEYATALYNAFKLYTEESNYPILFHCTSGADRTGTFAYLLCGMLGVELDDLYRDFELTSFAMGGKRWRSKIKQGDDGYYFTDDGYVHIEGNYVAMGLLTKGLMECYSTGDGKLSSAIKNYLKKDVGLTDEDFEAIERLMLE